MAVVCPSCGARYASAVRFCESCGELTREDTTADQSMPLDQAISIQQESHTLTSQAEVARNDSRGSRLAGTQQIGVGVALLVSAILLVILGVNFSTAWYIWLLVLIAAVLGVMRLVRGIALLGDASSSRQEADDLVKRARTYSDSKG